ncbi:MAG: DUF4386 family protein [Chloroflexota bacterium]
MNETNFNPKSLYTIGGIAAFIQLASILALIVVQAALGPKPAGAEAYFDLYRQSPLEMLLRGDFLLLFLLGAYLGTFPALYIALKRFSPVAVFYATLLTVIAVVGFFNGESTFALYYLGGQYVAATSETVRTQLLAAGQSVIASDAWNSSAAYLGGMMLQGSGVIISWVMLRSRDFSKVTAISGLIGNALDLIQHVLHPFAPSISAPIQMFMGIFYFVWFPMLGRDFFRLAKERA